MQPLLSAAVAHVDGGPPPGDPHGPVFWGGFFAFVLIMLALDLFVFHRKAHVVRVREALAWSVFWVSLAVIFGVGVWFAPQLGLGDHLGPEKAQRFFLGYVIEEALSVDNLFVFVIVFTYFKVEPKHQHRLLFWGILGALALRAIFIIAGVELMNQFNWLMYGFGALLVFTGLKLGFGKETEPHPDKNIVVRLAKKLLPITTVEHDGHFTKRIDGKFYFTSLFIVLLVVETTDVIFAVDSIPAVMGVAQEHYTDAAGKLRSFTDPFIVYTSNVFAIMGLRTLYFALAAIMGMFRFLKPALAFILTFIGVKMLTADLLHPYITKEQEIIISLSVVFGTLGLAVGLSLLFPPKPAKHGEISQVTPNPEGIKPLPDEPQAEGTAK